MEQLGEIDRLRKGATSPRRRRFAEVKVQQLP